MGLSQPSSTAAGPVYIVSGMAQLGLYVSKELHDAVKAAKVPVSEVCQKALRDELAARKRRHTSGSTGMPVDPTINQEASWPTKPM